MAIIDLIEKKFCNVKGIDLNLSADNLITLNRFEDATALLVSFKK